MQAYLPLAIALLSVLAVVQIGAPRLGIPAPILLALVGVLIGCFPFVSNNFALDPDLVLVGFLPPLLYADAFSTSWVDFRRWMRPIAALAIGLVAATIAVVGFVAHALLPELPIAVCFILGAIVSPTDTVAVQAVIEKLRIPRRATAIIGGESLVNDATGLVGVQLGVAVVLTGAFSLPQVTLEFCRVAGLGVLVGAAIGGAFAATNRLVRDGKALFVLSLLSPYLAFLVALRFELSGVLAVVVAGFIVAWRIHHIEPSIRVDLFATWSYLTHVLNGLCFLFVGLAAPYVVCHLSGDTDMGDLVRAGLGVSAAVVITRILWCFPNAYLPLWLMPNFRRKEGGYPSPRNVFLVSWCGARGIVSLAAALALPETLADGTPFPGRDEVIACTLAVILVTLIGQGLTLQPIIRILGIRDDDATEAERCHAREVVLEAGIQQLDAYCSETSCPISVHHYREAMNDELDTLRSLDEEQRRSAQLRHDVSREVGRAVRAAQERALLLLRDRGAINDQTYLALQLEMDRGSTI